MNREQIHRYVMRYLEATRCRIIEKAQDHVTAKLSPEADKALTDRTYYWSFVERTGVEPETMSFTFVFDPADRDFGFMPGPAGGRRILQEDTSFGSRRLNRIFSAVKAKGRFVHLFETPQRQTSPGQPGLGYTPWLGVNFKVELMCDMKRDEIHSLGICLTTGEIADSFHSRLLRKTLVPKLPANVHVRESIALETAAAHLESHLCKRIGSYDHSWAEQAGQRMEHELERVEAFYRESIEATDEENRPAAEAQYENRRREIEWQYRPRIQISVINCGIFHLERESFHNI